MKGTPVMPPVVLSATYRFKNSDELIDVVQNRSGFLYSRWDNPTVNEAENIIAKIESYESALAFGSGMAAITSSILALTPKNGRIVAQREIYGSTFDFLANYAPKLGIETVFVNYDDHKRFFKEINKGAHILYLETPTNPLLRVVDIEPLVQAAHEKGALVVLDSTFASPVNQHPADFGVDVVIHSATKYLGGHHDITAGFAVSNDKLSSAIWKYRKIFGGVMDPMTAFLAIRGMQTLDIRVRQQNENALKIAKFLESQDKIRIVNYPGLPSHPDHEIAKKQMRGFGGMLSFEIDADFNVTKKFMDSLKKIKLATSLGGVSSLANQPITNTHAALSPEQRAKAGISESLVRLSVGIEDTDELVEDLKQALMKI